MNKEELSYIKELKNNEFVYEYKDEIHGIIRIMIIYRGERLYFQLNEKATICTISARDSLLSKKSIKRWDNGDKIDNVDALCSIICEFYKKSYSDTLIVV